MSYAYIKIKGESILNIQREKKLPILMLCLGYLSVFGFYYHFYKFGQVSNWTFESSDALSLLFYFFIIYLIPLSLSLISSFVYLCIYLFKHIKVASTRFILLFITYFVFTSLLVLSFFSPVVYYSAQYAVLSAFCDNCQEKSSSDFFNEFKNKKIINEINNYMVIWDELLDAKTDKQLKKALVKSIINSDCMQYAFTKDNQDIYLRDIAFIKNDIIKGFSSNASKYIDVQILKSTYPIGLTYFDINEYISVQTNPYKGDDNESICIPSKDTETLFQELLLQPSFKQKYKLIKI